MIFASTYTKVKFNPKFLEKRLNVHSDMQNFNMIADQLMQ